MSFLKSVVFGYEGRYNILGIPVTFEKAEELPSNTIKSPEQRTLAKRMKQVLPYINRFMEFGYTHAFIHEMSHAIAMKFFRQNPKVYIYTGSDSGFTTHNEANKFAKWKFTIMASAGCIGSVAFWTSILFLVLRTEKHLSQYIVRVLIGFAARNIFIDGIAYPLLSIYKADGDFAYIAKRCGTTHLVLATTPLVMLTALATFTCYKALP